MAIFGDSLVGAPSHEYDESSFSSVFPSIIMKNQMPPQSSQEPKPIPPKKAGLPQVALAVFWSFLGVRKQKKWEEDATAITPVQAIIGGLIGAAIFIFILIMIVRMVT
jgi:hypothetical protein